MARGENYYKVTVESGVEVNGGIRTFIIDEADDELLWMLLRRIQVRQARWDGQQRDRAMKAFAEAREQRARDEAYRQRKMQEAAEEAARSFSDFSSTFGASGTFGPGAGPQFRGRPDGWYYNPRTEHKTGSPKIKSYRSRLIEMAELTEEQAVAMDAKKILKLAQRKCHPDTGGSHEKWIALDRLKQEMGM